VGAVNGLIAAAQCAILTAKRPTDPLPLRPDAEHVGADRMDELDCHTVHRGGRPHAKTSAAHGNRRRKLSVMRKKGQAASAARPCQLGWRA
jgi:hypothetical protein